MSSWPAPDDAFERLNRQIAEEERRLRQIAEEQLREYKRLVVEFAGTFLAAELDRRRRDDPFFEARATAETWRALLREATAQQRSWAEAVELAQLRAEVAQLRERIRTLEAGLNAAQPERPEPAAKEEQDIPETPVFLDLAHLTWPTLPATPPDRFAGVLTQWPRQGPALALLGVTGWSMRLAIVDLLAARLKTDAAALRRLLDQLTQARFCVEQKLTLNLLENQTTSLILIRLTPLGQEVVRACGLTPVPSEWERLSGLSGERIGYVCMFTYHARLRGWATALAAPDVLVRRGDETWRVMVVDGAPPPAAWPPAVVAPTAPLRRQIVAQWRSAGVTHGRATDLQTLLQTQAAHGPLWVEEW